MKTKDFYYELPQSMIAQTPLQQRDASRLMLLERNTGKITHRHFYELPTLLNPGDCLVINDSRVLPARIFGVKEDYAKPVEFLLLRQISQNLWEAICKPGKKAKTGDCFIFGDNVMSGTITDVTPEGNRHINFSFKNGTFFENLEKIGQMPLPPYITEKLADKERYQTVYSHELGSAAAPTAGLHFTPKLLEELTQKGVRIAKLTLHVGLGTFRPVKADEITDHKMHCEFYNLPQAAVEAINQTKAEGGRVISVGTTSCRTLESVFAKLGKIAADSGSTEIFIYPGFKFNVLDGLITNFHLPESTLIMLVAAFAGYKTTMDAYKTAVEEEYRFFSFGDSMMIV
ncbi:MAG: tRNA preQ1(34) S-adenosylmethionine ribosyltransferase-isomerase QueA [Oscillospiraceae bacterium]|nr:tRNA preQ1(34) S-adenosylmethionine ribosyltransferase-isomerase QueA [Oscillospiraceae bacterium]